MTEYVRSNEGKIQADLALRVGRLLRQYGDLTRDLREEKKYDTTLLICALQTLLANCSELLKAMKDRDRVMWRTEINNGIDALGINRNFDIQCNFPGVLTRERFVNHLRNAVSHPTYPDHTPHHQSTGYTTMPDDTGIISKIVFVDSPWIDRGRFHSLATSKRQETVEKCKNKLITDYGNDIELNVVQNLRGKYEVRTGDVPYYPTFKAVGSVSQLKMFAIELANYIAQPTREDWDGKTIHSLIAA